MRRVEQRGGQGEQGKGAHARMQQPWTGEGAGENQCTKAGRKDREERTVYMMQGTSTQSGFRAARGRLRPRMQGVWCIIQASPRQCAQLVHHASISKTVHTASAHRRHAMAACLQCSCLSSAPCHHHLPLIHPLLLCSIHTYKALHVYTQRERESACDRVSGRGPAPLLSPWLVACLLLLPPAAH